MADRKRRESERLIDQAVGISSSGKPNVTEAWQKILQESNNEFTELNKILRDSEVFPNQDEPIKSQDLGPDDFNELLADSADQLQLSDAESASFHSIQPAPITLNSGFREGELENGRRVWNLLLPECLPACCLPPARIHMENQNRVRKCETKLSKYCHELKLNFKTMESLLRFRSQEFKSIAKIPDVINAAFAQIWFTTFAFARQFNHSAQMDRLDLVFFRKKYQTLLAYARLLSSHSSSIDASLTTIEGKSRKLLHAMKETLTGSSTTDLATYSITPNDDFFVEGSSWTELAHRRPHHVNRYLSTPAKETVPSVLHLLQTLDRPDTLRERKQLDIFVKNVTKSGWTSYEECFDSEKRMKLLRLLLSETLGIVAQVIGICGKVERKLAAGNYSKPAAIFSCKETLLPWLRETKSCVTTFRNLTTYGPPEFEFLRYYIFSSEVRLERMINRGRSLGKNMEDICQVATISADLLEQKYGLLLPNYEEIRPYIKCGTAKEKVTEDSAISEFYLHGYGNVLKQSSISFRIARFILSYEA